MRIAIYSVFASLIGIAVGLRDAANRRVDLLREFLGTTLHSIGDAVIVTDSAGAIVFLNAVSESLTGWLLEEAAGRAVKDVFTVRKEGTFDAVEDPVMQVLHTGRTALLEDDVILLTRAGRPIPGNGVVELNVIDHGIGIAPADLPRVFQRFGQAHGEHSAGDRQRPHRAAWRSRYRLERRAGQRSHIHRPASGCGMTRRFQNAASGQRRSSAYHSFRCARYAAAMFAIVSR